MGYGQVATKIKAISISSTSDSGIVTTFNPYAADTDDAVRASGSSENTDISNLPVRSASLDSSSICTCSTNNSTNIQGNGIHGYPVRMAARKSRASISSSIHSLSSGDSNEINPIRKSTNNRSVLDDDRSNTTTSSSLLLSDDATPSSANNDSTRHIKNNVMSRNK